eukprot:COSAG03_NODE_2717_length_2499_cov_3.372917_2_plen_200_part_00
MAAAYSCADAYFTGSEFETLGFGAIEAMSCGAPALCPAAQGFRDTVQHGVSGYLYNPRSRGDAEECLRKLISGAEIDPAAVLAAGEHMTIAGCAVRARKVYSDAVATNRARSVRAVSCPIWFAAYSTPTVSSWNRWWRASLSSWVFFRLLSSLGAPRWFFTTPWVLQAKLIARFYPATCPFTPAEGRQLKPYAVCVTCC